ncbi:MAG: hypothetical protein QOG72_302 [Sphingomonadales bacterium]|nr:hypothetical protein [Sphingomonadales bacterium]
MAAAHDCDASDLPDEQRRLIDRQTLDWVRENASSGGIVEGRFLDAVLVPVRHLVCLVEVRADPEVRAQRWAERTEVPVTPAEIEGQDRTDAGFRDRIYSDSGNLTADLIANTNGGTSEWVDLLEMHYRSQLQRPG